MNKPDLLKPTLIAGLLIGVLYSIPLLDVFLTCCFCMALWAPGVISVVIYDRAARPMGYLVRAGDGALVGMISGVFGGITSSILDAAKGALWGNEAEQAQIDQALAGLPPDQAWIGDWMRGFLSYSQSISGMIVMLLISVFLFALFSAISGMITAMLVGRKGRDPQGASQWYPPTGQGGPATPHIPPPEPPPSAFGPGGSA